MAISQSMSTAADGTQIIRVDLGAAGQRSFRNRCPHLGIGLDWGDGQCLSDDGTLLVCAMHQALFDPDTGLCLAGPCAGKSLEAVKPDDVSAQP